jgi:chromosome segregation protein
MAEVSITLDNSEGWLPVDYSEVVVSRRAYRSGESEYLINKSRVRLRDVVELFARAQVGQNSYAFMGQGLVDEVLVMRPEERRRLLEEAADVRLLRQRLDEARDRLSATRENLERVQLLLDEIGPRLAQLERQASRAEQHGKLSRELAETLQELYRQQWRAVNEASLAARAALDQRHQGLIAAQEAAKAAEDSLNALTAALEDREKELGTRRERQRNLTDRIHAFEQRLALDQERTASQTARRAEVQAEAESLRAELADLQRAVERDTERQRNIVPEIEAARALVETRRQEMNALEQEQAVVRRRIAEGEDAIERANRGASEAAQALSKLVEDEARLHSEAQSSGQRKRDLLANLLAVGREFDTLRQRLATLDFDTERAERDRNEAASSVERGRTASSQLEGESLRLEASLSQATARLEMLRRLQSAAEGMEAGVRYLLGGDADNDTQDRRRSEAVEGLVGLVRDLIRVQPGLERAIEASLAENVQALVFENLPSALAAIDLLTERQGGRAVLYPLDVIRPQPPLNLMRERGVVGVAARLVRVDNRFRNLIDALLGRTIVVENVNLAQSVLRRGLGNVVTLDGVLLRPNGSVAGGVSATAAEAFTRQNELDELPDEIETLERRKRDVDQRLATEREALTRAEAALADAEPRANALREERGRGQTALLDNRGRLILLRSEARVFWATRASAGDDGESRTRRQRLTAERNRLQAEARATEDGLLKEREALAGFASRRNAAIDGISEAAAAHANLEGEARSLARQLEQETASVARAEQRLVSRDEAIAAIETDLTVMEARDAETTVELATAREEFEALAREMEPAEAELAHLLNRERTVREQLTAARTRMLEAERAHIEAESAVKLRGDEIEALRELMAGEGYRPEGANIVPVNAVPSSQEAQTGRFPPIRGAADVDVDTLRGRVTALRSQIRSLGPVNEQAATDYGESKERYDFLTSQVEDLRGSDRTLTTAIEELETNIRERLQTTFEQVDAQFQRYFDSFFEGGRAHLTLTVPDDMANTGIDIFAQPPGKRVNTIAMLSGGERALTALALLLALLDSNPSPICVLDEVDAALDETNVGRFVEALRALEQKTQFVIITHNPRTVEAADQIYGISMGSDNTSRILSLRLDEVKNN